MRLRTFLGTAARSAALLATLLLLGLALNGLLLGYAVFRMAGSYSGSRLSDCAQALENDGRLSPELETALDAEGCWLMLLDSQGKVIYDYRKPPELPESYSLADVAAFTRWYLEDHPVRVQTLGEGLIVMGQPKNSVWKYNFETAMPNFWFWPVWGTAALLCNFLLILLVSVASVRRGYKKRDAARTEWIAAVSHDVRTPLATVLGYSANLESDPALPEAEREQAAQIRAKGEELRRLIENLNITNRLQHSMEPLQAAWFSPAGAIRECAAAFLNDEANALFDIQPRISPAAAAMQLYGDKGLMLRALNNLVGNSLRHNPGGCTVLMELSAKGRALTLTVSDDGAGYTAEQLKKLKKNTPAVSSGHGLGLVIVGQAVRAQHGRVRFSNGDSGGALCEMRFRGPLLVRRAPTVPAVEDN